MKFLVRVQENDVYGYYEEAEGTLCDLKREGEARIPVSCREEADALWDWIVDWDGESSLDVCFLATETGEAAKFLTEAAAEKLAEKLVKPTQWKESLLRMYMPQVCGAEVESFDEKEKRLMMQGGGLWLVSGLYPDFSVQADVRIEAEKKEIEAEKAETNSPKEQEPTAVFFKENAKKKKTPKKMKATSGKAEVSHATKEAESGKREMTPEQRRAHIDEAGQDYVYTIE